MDDLYGRREPLSVEQLYHPPAQSRSAVKTQPLSAASRLPEADDRWSSLPASLSGASGRTMASLAGTAMPLSGTMASRPLSSFVINPSPSALRPALEVDCFAWPPICGTLDEHFGGAIDGFAAELARASSEGRQVLAFSSQTRGTGRTTLIAWVARHLASQGYTVALVDADFEKPDLATHLGLAVQAGLESVLLGDRVVEEVLVRSIEDNLTLLACCESQAAENPIARMQLVGVLNELRSAYQIVLVDAGPAGSPATVATLGIDNFFWLFDGSAVDAAGAEREARSALDRSGLVAGLVENFAPAPTAA